MMRQILHIDLDAFFVSVERVLDPRLRDRPVIVGGDPRGRGVVASASYEARRHGVRSAMPLAQAQKLCPEAVFVVSRHGRYLEFSRAVHSILKTYAPVVEAASVDEFYLEMTGCERLYGNLFTAAARIKEHIREKLGLPSSIGLGTNKLIAKIATNLCKPDGLLWVFPGEETSLLAPLPVGHLPGIGQRTRDRLHELGIRTIGDLSRFPPSLLSAVFGAWGQRMSERTRGSCLKPVVETWEPKSISREMTFDTDTVDPRILEATLCRLVERAGYALRRLNMTASTVGMKLRYADFQTISRSRTIPASDDDVSIFRTARALLEKAFTRRVRIRLLGVKLSSLVARDPQGVLFDRPEEIRRARLLGSADRVREKYGMEALHLGTALGYKKN
jgi:DNA polymerase-4